MGTCAHDADIIVLSDDEDEASENHTPCTESPVYIVEPEIMRKPGNNWIRFSHPPVPVVLLLCCK